jgi:hypothetical protein
MPGGGGAARLAFRTPSLLGVASALSASRRYPLRSCLHREKVLWKGGTLTTFRINTCKSVSKQTTLTTFRMNTCEKRGGGGTPTYAMHGHIIEQAELMGTDAKNASKKRIGTEPSAKNAWVQRPQRTAGRSEEKREGAERKPRRKATSEAHCSDKSFLLPMMLDARARPVLKFLRPPWPTLKQG